MWAEGSAQCLAHSNYSNTVISSSSNSSSNSKWQQPPEGENSWRKYSKCSEVYPLTWFWQAWKKPQLLILATEHGAPSLFGSRDETVLAKETSSSSVGRKTYSMRQVGGGGDPASPLPLPCLPSPEHQPAARVTVIPQTFTDHFLSKTLKARGAEEKTETWSTQGRGLASTCSRKLVPEKNLHCGHQSKVGEGFHIHKDFSRMGCDKSTKSN